MAARQCSDAWRIRLVDDAPHLVWDATRVPCLTDFLQLRCTQARQKKLQAMGMASKGPLKLVSQNNIVEVTQTC